MEAKEILEKLVGLSDSYKSMSAGVPENLEAKITLCNIGCENVHIFSGINALADACGESLSTREGTSAQFPVEYFFRYKGKYFFQLDTDPPEKMA